MEENKNEGKMVGFWYFLVSLFSLIILFSFYRIYNGESGNPISFVAIMFLFFGLAMIGKVKQNLFFYGFSAFGIISMIAGLYFLFSR